VESAGRGLDAVRTGNKLRDHMTDLELIFTMLGEASTTEIARRSDALGFDEIRTSAKEGGKIAGTAEQTQSSGEVKGVQGRVASAATCAVRGRAHPCGHTALRQARLLGAIFSRARSNSGACAS
jgi:hypothetical protein